MTQFNPFSSRFFTGGSVALILCLRFISRFDKPHNSVDGAEQQRASPDTSDDQSPHAGI